MSPVTLIFVGLHIAKNKYARVSRLTHLTAPSAPLLLRISHLSYYLLSSTQSLQSLKQCLHYDPDSKPCRAAHRRLKALDKDFARLEKLEAEENWRGVISLATTLSKKFDEALEEDTKDLGLPESIAPKIKSPRRLKVYKAACRAYGRIMDSKRGLPWCETTLTMNPEDEDGLVNKGDILLGKEEWEDAVRAYDKASEASGRSNQRVSVCFVSSLVDQRLLI